MSLSRRKQSKPRHLNKEDSASPTEPETRGEQQLKSVEYPSDENIQCENCRMEFSSAETFLVHMRQCQKEGIRLAPSPGRDGNHGEQRETAEELEETPSENNDGNSESDFGGYYRLTTDQVQVSNGYQYVNDETEDNDDESSVADSQEGCAEILEKEADDAGMDSETRVHVKSSQIAESGRVDAEPDNGPSRMDGSSSRLSEEDVMSIQSKMLDVHQLYVVLFQLQQQQLLQLRLIDIIQKRLAENVLPTTGDILSSLPDLATVPRFAGPASVFGSLTPHVSHAFPVNGALPSTPFGGATGFPEDESNGRGAAAAAAASNQCSLRPLWPAGLPLLPPRKSLVSENGADDQRKRDKVEDPSKNRSSAGPIVEDLSIVLPVSLTSEQRSLPGSGLFEQSTTKSLAFGSSVGDLTESFKKGKLPTSSLSTTLQLSSDPSSVTDATSSDDSAIFRHRCRLCFKVLGSDSALQIHMRSHTGERPYKCNICGNRFTTKGNLKVHFSRHQDQYPHIRMNPDPVPEHLDQLGSHNPPHPPPPPPPPPPQLPNNQLPPPPHLGFCVQSSFMPAVRSLFQRSGLGGSPCPTPSTSVVASTSSVNAANRERFGKDDNIGKVKCETSPAQRDTPLPNQQSNYGVFESNETTGGIGQQQQQQRTLGSSDARTFPKDEQQSKLLIGSDIPGTCAPFFPSPLTALSSMSSALPTLRSPLNLSFPSPLSMSAAQGFGMLPPYRFEPPPLIPFSRNPVSASAKDDDPLEQFMEIQLSESGKLDELVREGEGKVSDPNECAVCHRVLSCRSALQMHYRTHTGERPYRCKLCSRTFTTKGNLKTHMSVHRGKANGPTVHRCPVCSRDFTNPLILQQHMRVHASELSKPFPPLPTGPPMMMPMLNHLLPFSINFPYFGHGFPRLQQPMPAFQPQPSNHKTDADSNSRRKSVEEVETEPKKRKISTEEDEYNENDYQGNSTRMDQQKDESGGDCSNSSRAEENVEMGAAAGIQEDSKSEVSVEDEPQDANDGNASLSCCDENTNDDDSYTERFDVVDDDDENRMDEDAYRQELIQRRPESSFSTTGGEGDHRHNDGERHEEESGPSSQQSPNIRSSLPSYASYPSLTGQYSSPLTALEERVNALGYPGHRFKQVLRSDLDGAIGTNQLKSEVGERTEDETGHQYRHAGGGGGGGGGGLYRLTEQSSSSSSMFLGSFGDISNMVKFGGNAGVVSQSPGALFHSSGSLESQKHHVVCQVCGKTFACRSALEIHLRSHTKEKPFQCQICGRAFSTKGNLKQHVLMTHSLSSTDNDVSGHRPNSPSSSDGSLPPPHSTPPISVSVLASTGLGLSSHMLQQVGEAANGNESSTGLSDQSPGLGATPPEKKSLMRYLCNVCKKPFSSTSALEIHTRTHTGDRPFVCSLCSKAFTTKGNLKVHMGTHAWNKCPSRRGRRMLMDPMPNFKNPTQKERTIFGRFPQSAVDALPFAMLRYPEYFIQGKACGDSAAPANGFTDGCVAPLSLKFESSSTPGTFTDPSQFQNNLGRRDASPPGSKPVELKMKIKEESNNNNSSSNNSSSNNSSSNRSVMPSASTQDRCNVAATAVQVSGRASSPSPVMTKGYTDLVSAADAVTQSSLIWPTDPLSQGAHQQVALNCR